MKSSTSSATACESASGRAADMIATPALLDDATARAYEPLVRATVRRVAHSAPSHVDLDALLSAAWAGLLAASNTFCGERSCFASWAKRKVNFYVRDALRRALRCRLPAIDMAMLDDEDTPLAPEGPFSSLDRLAVREALARLSRSERIVVELYHVRELAHGQIADRLGIVPLESADILERAEKNLITQLV